MTDQERYWAAGFLDGEGCFLVIKRDYGMEIRVEATQVQRWPLRKLKRLFGGTIHRRPKGARNQRDYRRWRCNGRQALNVMTTLEPLLSPVRRRKIRNCLASLKAVNAL